jgi:hypothetical protein
MACVILTRQTLKLLHTAKTANDLSRHVAELLRNYDTDGVSGLLDEYCTLEDADPALVESYTALVGNLNKYRPHLPNWMVQRSDGSEEDVEMGSDRSTRSTRSTRSNMSRMSRSESRQSKGLSATATEKSNDRMCDMLPCGPPKKAAVAFAVLDFRTRANVHLSAASRGAVVNCFVDRVHKIAAATHCAVHSFVGDTVQLSWNAAMRAVQPELKAVRFLCRLKAAMADDDDVSIAGAAMHGSATTQFAGTGTVQALAVSMPWRAALDVLFRFASAHRALVVDGALAAASKHVCSARAVDILAIPSDDGRTAEAVVHEVLVEHDIDNDEWMYVLSKKEGRGEDIVSSAVAMCAQGDYGEAVQSLELAGDSSRLAAHLLRRAEEALQVHPAVFAAALCHCAARAAPQLSEATVSLPVSETMVSASTAASATSK